MEVVVDHSLKRSLETQKCKQSFKLNAPRFPPPEWVKVPLLSFYLCSETTGWKLFIESLWDGGGLKWAVRSKGSSLHITKRGCVMKHPSLLLLRKAWSLPWLTHAEGGKASTGSESVSSNAPQWSYARDKAHPNAVQPVVCNSDWDGSTPIGEHRVKQQRVVEGLTPAVQNEESPKGEHYYYYYVKWVGNVTRGPIMYLPKAHGCKASVTLMVWSGSSSSRRKYITMRRI